MGLLTGVGIMTIKYPSPHIHIHIHCSMTNTPRSNIGHNVQALWTYSLPSAPAPAIAHAQLLHVSFLSLGSFAGRLASGIGSDYLVQQQRKSRFWCVVVAALLFAADQLFAIHIEDPNHLWVVSALCGLAYGTTFGVLPAVVVDTFGPGEFHLPSSTFSSRS